MIRKRKETNKKLLGENELSWMMRGSVANEFTGRRV